MKAYETMCETACKSEGCEKCVGALSERTCVTVCENCESVCERACESVGG